MSHCYSLGRRAWLYNAWLKMWKFTIFGYLKRRVQKLSTESQNMKIITRLELLAGRLPEHTHQDCAGSGQRLEGGVSGFFYLI